MNPMKTIGIFPFTHKLNEAQNYKEEFEFEILLQQPRAFEPCFKFKLTFSVYDTTFNLNSYVLNWFFGLIILGFRSRQAAFPYGSYARNQLASPVK